jgi:hypothetical protein
MRVFPSLMLLQNMQRKALEGRLVQCIGDSWGTVPPNWRITFSEGFYGRSDRKL